MAPRVGTLATQLLESHPEICNSPTCPFAYPNRPLTIADRFIAAEDAIGGWGHRQHFTGLGTLGEHLAHLAIPEIRLLNGISPIPTPMDGASPQGPTEIKTATLQLGPDEDPQHAFTIRPSQRQEHALPGIFVALDDGFVEAFHGEPLELPADLVGVLDHVEALFAVPLMAYPQPQRTFIVPKERSTRRRTRALQVLFRFSYREFITLGLNGLSRLRAVFDSPQVVTRCMRFLDELSDRLEPAELRKYRLDPRRLMIDASGYDAGVPLNGRVAEALALRELRKREIEREGRRAIAAKRSKQRQREQRRTEDRRLRVELAFALVGILTQVAQRPISAIEMRNRFGLPRDQLFPPCYGERARARGIPVCLPGERRRVVTKDGRRIRHLTQQERKDLAAHISEWLELVRSNQAHPLVSRVLDLWCFEEEGGPGRLAYEEIMGEEAVSGFTQGSLLFG